jgi:hypothetical protein
MRDVVRTVPQAGYFEEKIASGWRLAAIDWERDAPDADAPQTQEVPFGLQIAGDCGHLEENLHEKRMLSRMMELIVQDRPLSEVAAKLNADGHRTRTGSEWTAPALFDLLPRLIDAGPRILTDNEYVERKRK